MLVRLALHIGFHYAAINSFVQSKPTPYRDGQNVIRNSRTREIVYMPPEAKAVPGLMSDLVKRGAQDQSGLLRNLDPRERQLLELFRRNGTATAEEIANHLKFSGRRTKFFKLN
jgi:hypothetical protein